MLRYYSLSDQTKTLVIQLVLIHNIFNAFVSPFAASLGSGLRAAGDVRFTMIVSIAATIGVRLVLSYVLGERLNMGVIGIAWAMCANWCASAVCYLIRFKAGTWQRFSLI